MKNIKNKRLTKLSSKLEVNHKYTWVIIKRPSGLITVNRSTIGDIENTKERLLINFKQEKKEEEVRKEKQEEQNKKMQDSIVSIEETDVMIYNVDVNFETRIAWTQKVEEKTSNIINFDNKYSDIDINLF